MQMAEMQTTTVQASPMMMGARTMSGLGGVLAGLAVYEWARSSTAQMLEPQVDTVSAPGR